mgnify:FL=1|jgi:hypothetical protein|tara:strand:+ start:279 stop:452 length:174 start_codon:yes stop_codon:yes gene_type:complete
MIEIKDLKKEHKGLEAAIRKIVKRRLNERTSNSWKDLRKLKKLKLKIKDQINSLKHH